MMTEAQRRLLSALAEPGSVLKNADEATPPWWVSLLGGYVVRVHTLTAEIVTKRGWAQIIRHEGGHPGLDTFALSDLGRAALAEEKP